MLLPGQRSGCSCTASTSVPGMSYPAGQAWPARSSSGVTWPSKTIHYEITGAGRIDYQFNPSATEGPRGDPHGVVKILTIDLGSH